jgi:urease gamma subunit
MNWEQVRKLFLEWFLSEWEEIEKDFSEKTDKLIERLREQNYHIDKQTEELLRKLAEELYHKTTALITHVVNAVNKTAKLQKDALVMQIAQEIINSRWDDGLKLSERFWDFSQQAIARLKNTIMEGIRYDNGVKTLMYKLQYTIEALEGQEFAVVLKEQLPKWLKEFEESTRGLLVNAESKQAWEKIKRKVEKYIEKRSREGTYYAGKQLLKEIENALWEGKMELVNKAVRWWVYDKQLYRLKTIAWTEAAHAYLKATVELTKDEEEIVGYQWRLSRSHPRADICDVYANVDYGLGRGVHPKGKLPRLPAHPHCMCYLIPIVKRKGMEEREKPHIPETALESWAPRWLKKYAEENGLSLADLFNFEEGRFLRMREIGNLKVALPQLRKPEVLIEKYEFRTIQNVEKLVLDITKLHEDLFFYKPKELVVEEGDPYTFWMAVRGYPDGTVRMFLNKVYEKPLLTALQNLRNNAPLTKQDELMLSVLWHEFTHLRTINFFKVLRHFGTSETYLMEMLTEFVSRHTYDKLLDILKPGTKPKFQEQLIEKSEGYQIFVERFRYLLRKFEINEKEAVKELEDVLIEGTQHGIFRKLADWLGTKVDLTDIERYTILDEMVDLERISDQAFRKEVDRHYELVKRRQRRDNG